MLYILKSKLGALRQRESASDQSDIVFLLTRYTEETKACVSELNSETVEFFIERAPEEEKEYWEDFFGVSRSESGQT